MVGAGQRAVAMGLLITKTAAASTHCLLCVKRGCVRVRAQKADWTRDNHGNTVRKALQQGMPEMGCGGTEPGIWPGSQAPLRRRHLGLASRMCGESQGKVGGWTEGQAEDAHCDSLKALSSKGRGSQDPICAFKSPFLLPLCGEQIRGRQEGSRGPGRTHVHLSWTDGLRSGGRHGDE